MINKIKELSWGLLGLALPIASIIILIVLFKWGVLVSAIVLPFIQFIATLVFVVDLIILLPLSAFKKTREFSAIGFLVSSYILGIELWFRSLLLTYLLWGLFGVLIGLAFLGVGVLPMAILATLFNGSWIVAIFLLLSTVIVYGMRSFAMYLANKVEEDNINMIQQNYNLLNNNQDNLL